MYGHYSATYGSGPTKGVGGGERQGFPSPRAGGREVSDAVLLVASTVLGIQLRGMR